MEVILLKKYGNLGYENEIVKVADGYGRNFLIPKLIAVKATDSMKKVALENIKQSKKKEEILCKNANSIVEKLKNVTIQIHVNADNKNKLFAKVSAKEIIQAINSQTNCNVDGVLFNEPLNKIGKFEVKVRVYKKIETLVKVDVMKR